MKSAAVDSSSRLSTLLLVNLVWILLYLSTGFNRGRVEQGVSELSHDQVLNFDNQVSRIRLIKFAERL